LITLVQEDKIARIFIHYKDRLTRFGFHYLQLICDFHKTEIVIVSTETEDKTRSEELAEDILFIIHSFSGKLDGLQKKVKEDICMELEKDTEEEKRESFHYFQTKEYLNYCQVNKEFTKQNTFEICQKYHVIIRYMETDKDPIHYMIETEPTMSISKIVNLMKSYPTYPIWERYSNYLRKHVWKEHTFWIDG